MLKPNFSWGIAQGSVVPTKSKSSVAAPEDAEMADGFKPLRHKSLQFCIGDFTNKVGPCRLADEGGMYPQTILLMRQIAADSRSCPANTEASKILR